MWQLGWYAEAGGFLVRRRVAAARQRKAIKQSVGKSPDSSDEGKAADDGTDDIQPSTAAPAEIPAAPATPSSPQRLAGAAAGTAEEGVSSAVKKSRDKDPLEELLEEDEEEVGSRMSCPTHKSLSFILGRHF